MLNLFKLERSQFQPEPQKPGILQPILSPGLAFTFQSNHDELMAVFHVPDGLS